MKTIRVEKNQRADVWYLGDCAQGTLDLHRGFEVIQTWNLEPASLPQQSIEGACCPSTQCGLSIPASVWESVKVGDRLILTVGNQKWRVEGV